MKYQFIDNYRSEFGSNFKLSFLFTLLLSTLFAFFLLVLIPLHHKYVILYFFFVIIGIIFLITEDKSLIFAWFLLFFTAVNRTRILTSPHITHKKAGISLFFIFLVISVALLVLIKKHMPIRLQELKVLLFIYSCYLGINILVSLRYALEITLSFYEILWYFSFILVILFWERISRNVSDTKLNSYMLILFLIGAFEGILAIVQVIFRIDMNFWKNYEITHALLEESKRAEGSMLGYTGLGNYLAILFPFIFSNFLYKKSNLKLIFLILTGIGLFLTFTRIAWLGAGIGTFFTIGILLKRKKFSFKKLFSLGIISFVLLTIILLPFYKQIIIVTNDLLLRRGDTLSSRIDTYRTAWKMIIDSHFIGIGLKNYYSVMYGKYFGSAGWMSIAHNSYLVVLTESGAIGLFLFLATYLYLLMFGFKMINRLDNNSLAFYTSIGMIGAVVSFFICSFLNMTNTYNHAMNLLWNIIAIGLIYGISGCQKARTV